MLTQQCLLVSFCCCVKAVRTVDIGLKGEGKHILHGDLICTYTLPEYISAIYVDGLCIISVKL